MTDAQRKIVDEAYDWTAAIEPMRRTPSDYRVLALVAICADLDAEVKRCVPLSQIEAVVLEEARRVFPWWIWLLWRPWI